ncbi:MAG: NAD-dependent epimerase/dehydratase family protein [Oscillospiraceae bacterium]|nr:NAD-dependent epimerase/dehydratase family protein [Oscillospiraceae bacterium]
MKKILVLGGTGAMGIYLVPELIRMGHAVDVVSLDERVSDDPNLRYITADAMDNDFLEKILKNGYSGIVDFMIYKTPQFRARYELLLNNTDHYIYLSSYRVYADSPVITETSPRLLDVSGDQEYLATEDYSLIKARGEDILAASSFDNYTMIRPAITFSSFRYQLVTLEANVFVDRMYKGKTVLLPEAAMDVQATMSWAGDVAKMIARLLFKKHTMKERYTLATAEHQTWGEVAGYYREIGGLKPLWVDTETYLKMHSGSETIDPHKRWQLDYDRLFNRVVDNRKILEATGMKQSELMKVKDGLAYELSRLPKGYVWPESKSNDMMDAYLAERGMV